MAKPFDRRSLNSQLRRAKDLCTRDVEAEEEVTTPRSRRLSLVRWIKSNLYIRAKGGDLALFENWTYPQKVIAAYVVRQFALNRPVRAIVHKSRQLGVSTVVEAIIFALLRYSKETAGMVIADLKETAKAIFSNVERFQQYLSEEEKALCPVKGDQAYSTKLTYEYPLRSEMFCTTADTPRAAAGLMLCYVHISESAFIAELAKVMLGVMPTVPGPQVTPRTLVIHESTANGKNEFHRLVKRAQEEESDWDFFFFGLKDDPSARLPLKPGEVFELDEEEAAYAEHYGMGLEQMKWCRWKRLDECGGSWEYFHQEYPVESELAFQFSGMPFFDRKRIAEDLKTLQAPLFVGHTLFKAMDRPLVGLQPDNMGPVSIWEHPVKGVSYSLGGDVALGVGADYSELPVLRDDTGEEVARYRSNKVEPGQFAVECFKLGMVYNCGLLGVENNSIGQGTLGPLRDGHGLYPQMAGGYPNLYYETYHNKAQDEETERMGFSTTGRSKMPALEAFRELYNAGLLKVRSKTALEQMDGFAWDAVRGRLVQNYEDPKTGLPNDDGVMSTAIANTMRLHGASKRYCKEPTRETW